MASLQKPPTVNDDYRAQDIYRKAADIIHEKGFDATSMGDIADSVDLTKGGLYYYIKGKKALLFAIMNFGMDLLEDEVMTPALQESDPAARIALLVSGHLRLTFREPSAMAILASEAEGLDNLHRPKILDRKQRFPDLLEQSIRTLVEDDPQRSQIDPALAALSIMGVVQWTVHWYKPDGRLNEDEIVAQVTQLILHGIGSKTS